MEDIIVSVIIPAYNVEPYIEKCIDSIIMQTQKNVEIIIINDGSTDGTANIVACYAEVYSNIRVVQQENRGLSGARNAGLRIATGEYVVFVDSDDWLTSTDALSKMVSSMKCTNSDYIQCSFEFVRDGGKMTKFVTPSINCIEGADILSKTINVEYIYTSTWAKIYSRKFLIDNSLFFIDGLVNEDTAFSIMIALKASRVSFLKDIVCSIREREGSLSRASFKRMFESMHVVLDYTRAYLRSCGRYDSVKNIYEARYERSMLYNLLQTAQRNNLDIFMDDYDFCCRETAYLSKVKYGKYLPIIHRIMVNISKYPRAFYILANIAKAFGLKMH